MQRTSSSARRIAWNGPSSCSERGVNVSKPAATHVEYPACFIRSASVRSLGSKPSGLAFDMAFRFNLQADEPRVANRQGERTEAEMEEEDRVTR